MKYEVRSSGGRRRCWTGVETYPTQRRLHHNTFLGSRLDFLPLTCSVREEGLRLRIESLALRGLPIHCDETTEVQGLARLLDSMGPGTDVRVALLAIGATLPAHDPPSAVLSQISLLQSARSPVLDRLTTEHHKFRPLSLRNLAAALHCPAHSLLHGLAHRPLHALHCRLHRLRHGCERVCGGSRPERALVSKVSTA